MADGWIRYDASTQRIELPLALAEELAEVLEVPAMLVEVHPTYSDSRSAWCIRTITVNHGMAYTRGVGRRIT